MNLMKVKPVERNGKQMSQEQEKGFNESSLEEQLDTIERTKEYFGEDWAGWFGNLTIKASR